MKATYWLVYMLLLSACLEPQEKLPTGEKKLDPSIVNNPATASATQPEVKPPEMTFEKTTHHFGEIIEGEKVSFVFRFTNTGGSDLVIASAQGSCGCTVPEFTREPIKPGGKGELKVTFDSSGRAGMQSKTITVISNGVPATRVLTVSAEVKRKE
jgi:hypothetical protein